MEIGIIGAGTLAKFIIDIIQRVHGYKVVCLYDDHFPKINECSGVPVIGRLDSIGLNMKLAIGIGDPVLRKSLYERFSAQGASFCSIVDPSCIISSAAKVGDAVVIGPFSSVLSGSSVGHGACLLSHVNVNQNVEIGPFALVGAGSILGNEARIGQGAHLGLGSRIQFGMRVEDWAIVKSS